MSNNTHPDRTQPAANGAMPGLLPTSGEPAARLVARAGALVAASVATGCVLTVYMMLSRAHAATDDGFLMGDQQKMQVVSLCLIAAVAVVVGLLVWFKQPRWASALLLAWIVLTIVLGLVAGRLPSFSVLLAFLAYESLRGAVRLASYRRQRPQPDPEPAASPAFY